MSNFRSNGFFKIDTPRATAIKNKESKKQKIKCFKKPNMLKF